MLWRSLLYPAAILFLGDRVAQLSGERWSLTAFSRNTDSNELFTSGFSLRCEHLRTFFVGLEALVKHGCTLKGRFDPDRLRSNYTLTRDDVEWYCAKTKCDDLISTVHSLLNLRNDFAHSIEDCENLKYEGLELKICFSRSHLHQHCGRTGRTADESDFMFFVEDAFQVSSRLISAFQVDQHRQIDIPRLPKIAKDWIDEQSAK